MAINTKFSDEVVVKPRKINNQFFNKDESVKSAFFLNFFFVVLDTAIYERFEQMENRRKHFEFLYYIKNKKHFQNFLIDIIENFSQWPAEKGVFLN